MLDLQGTAHRVCLSEKELNSMPPSATSQDSMLIRVGHSPDPDDAFMFHALANNSIDTGRYRFVHELQDIETLNRRAFDGELELTAVSIHAFAFLDDKYALCASGASMGDNYGPMVVAREQCGIEDLKGKRIAIPGELTSAFLSLRLLLGDTFEYQVEAFDEILNLVEAGKYDAGLIIHEGQLTYADQGLKLIVDLGKWWYDETGGLPLPLGGNAIRRDLGEQTMLEVTALLKQSIQYGLDHRQAALDHAMKYGRDLDLAKTDRFVSMYVNDWTIDFGEKGREAVRLLLKKGFEAGIIPRLVVPDFVG
jgi:5,8-dihydroxy-2-naphthoate synthase